MNIIKTIALLALAALATLNAQTALTTTTLSSAVTSTSDVYVNVASATGITAGTTGLYVDREQMPVISVSGTRIRVMRSSNGTTHASGATVHVVPLEAFTSYDRSGTCTATQYKYLPLINPNTGNIWDCKGSAWALQQVQPAPVFSQPRSSSQFFPTLTVSTIGTATAVTLTAAQTVGGMILQDPTGGAVTTTLPTAALLLAAVPAAKVGSAFEFTIRNTADAAETITVAAGSGGTASGTMTIAQNNSKRFLVVFTNVSTAAYTVYSLGTVVH